MSFMHTQGQMRARTKTVTRRLGWAFLKPGDRLRAVEKAQGFKNGEKQVTLGVIEVTSARRELLGTDMTREDVSLEGFGEDMTVAAFVDMFCRNMRCDWNTPVTRIEFKYVEPPDDPRKN